MDKEKMKQLVKETVFYDKCKNCGHSRDWHEDNDLLGGQLFGIKLGECHHSHIDDMTKPFWKRKKIYCKCKEFTISTLSERENKQ